MAGANYKAPRLYDTPVPDLFTLVAQENPHRDFVQVIREHADAPIDTVRYTWSQVIQHAQNAAADLRARWAGCLTDESAKHTAAQPREPGSASVVVGLLSSNGYEMYINILACSLNRWAVLLISPKNSPAAIEHLLRTSKSAVLLVERSQLEFGRTMEQALPSLTAITVATLDSPANGPAASPLSPLTSGQLKKEMDLPAFYLHTSGSTGHPKIIPWSHNFFLSGCRTRQRDGDDEIGLPYYSIPPLVHAMGMFSYAMFAPAHANLIIFVSYPTPRPPSAAAILRHLPFIKGTIIALPPSILEELHGLGPEAIKTFAEGTTAVVYAGAPLKAETGAALIAAGLKPTTAYGSTEINVGTKLRPAKNPDDWEYVEFREGYDWQFLPVDSSSNLRELVVAPGPEDCPAVINHENPRGFATNDIWEPHPSVPNLWKHHSRVGDVTVLSNGEKSDNKQIEGLLLKDRGILHVQVFGAGRTMNGVIIQPRDSSIPIPTFLSNIQPTIEHANTILPKHSRLVPELILVAPPDRPFATTDKGTIKKKETLDKFEREIESAYEKLESGAGEEWAFEGCVAEERDLRAFVRSAVRSVLGEELPDAADLFEHGLDSLLSMRLRVALVSLVRKTVTSDLPVPRNIAYSYPTINALTAYLLSRAAPGVSDHKREIEEQIRHSIYKFSANFVPHTPGSRTVHGNVVALSGSTGSVGSSILGLLLARDDVEKVYLLNRKGSEAQEVRQARGLRARGLDSQMLESKRGRIVYLDVDFSRKDLGLVDKDYEELRDNVTHIVHAAWHLNFNLILESYERVHISGVRHLVDLALASPHAQTPRLTFLSSVAAAGMYHGPSPEPAIGERAGQRLVPEEPIDDPSMPLDQGYGHAKYVSERVLVGAVGAGLRATIVRLGQLSGVATNGAWAPSEYVPIMVRSSIALGMVPEDLPPVRWVPSDIAASAIVKQAFHDASALEYFSVENPVPTSWAFIAATLAAASPRLLKLVPLSAWLAYIHRTSPDPEIVPAVRLLDFYHGLLAGGEGVAALGWEKSVQVAPELEVGRIGEQLVAKYVNWQVETARTV